MCFGYSVSRFSVTIIEHINCRMPCRFRPMIASGRRRIYGAPEDGLRLGLPVVWTRALGLKPGDSVEVLFDDVLLVIPVSSRQADRVRRAMEG